MGKLCSCCKKKPDILNSKLKSNLSKNSSMNNVQNDSAIIPINNNNKTNKNNAYKICQNKTAKELSINSTGKNSPTNNNKKPLINNYFQITVNANASQDTSSRKDASKKELLTTQKMNYQKSEIVKKVKKIIIDQTKNNKNSLELVGSNDLEEESKNSKIVIKINKKKNGSKKLHSGTSMKKESKLIEFKEDVIVSIKKSKSFLFTYNKEKLSSKIINKDNGIKSIGQKSQKQNNKSNTSAVEVNPLKSKKDIVIDYRTFIKGKNYSSLVKEYQLGKILGEGSYGKVQKVLHKSSNQVRAMKVILKKEACGFEEIENLILLNHPNIVKLFEYFYDDENIYIITEFCKGGELFDKIKEREHFNEKDAAIVMKSILQAIGYCHSKGIIHRDLKPENILLEGTDLSQIKIIDFGASILRKDNKVLKDKQGTPYYVAPEVLKGNYNEKCDIWSIGVILYILLTGTPPFNGNDEDEICHNILVGTLDFDSDVFSDISYEGLDFLQRLLVRSPNHRPSVMDALQHPWIKQLAPKAKVSKSSALKIFKNLENFSTKQKLQEAVVTFIANQLMTSDEMKQLKQIFLEIDENGDGVLTKEELNRGLSKFYNKPIPKEQTDKIFQNIDADNSGTISYDEFIRATIDKRNILTDKKLKAAYNLFDKNGDGNIEAKEIKEVLGNIDVHNTIKVDDKIWDQLIGEADLDGNGMIDYEEFKAMMHKLYDKS